jgi:hypothetical protein
MAMSEQDFAACPPAVAPPRNSAQHVPGPPTTMLGSLFSINLPPLELGPREAAPFK